MFKEIVTISKNYAIVKIDNVINDDLLNLNVVFEEQGKRILGEVEGIIGSEARINFLGEFHDNKFYDGIIRKPSTKATIRIINADELAELTGYNDSHGMLLGLSPLYNNSPIKVNIDDMWSNHTAIFGNTGSGKTYGVARIVQNLFSIPNFIPFNSIIFLFNNTDEYDNAFNAINSFNYNYNYKLFTTNTEKKDNLLKLPLWLLSVDDYANLLDISEYSQIMIIEKMLNTVSLFAKDDEESKKYKNHMIAKAIISVLYSNQVSARIRDQIFSILTDCNTPELNLEVEVPGVGYTRSFRKCFEIDSQGQFAERVLITEYINKFIDNETEWKEEYTPTFFTIDNLEDALNFTLISEGYLNNDKLYSEAAALKVKLHSIAKSSLRNYFECDKFITINDYISELILIGNNKRAQIINFVLEGIDDRFAKALVKIYSRIIFNFVKSLPSRGAMPIHIMLEEAHRYVQRDLDSSLLGYNIFERIAKEGRKFGLVMDLITQRPTELSESVISQCSNFLIFKINHPMDLEYIEKMVPNISEDVIEKQKSLQAGTCIAFGKMMKIPMIVKMQIPNPAPQSSNANIFEKWMIQWKNN
ncbi:MAG: ATP-binding protein [Firmicutes bacterium]|nr:ATP-binding protein [Bacillota bacterium]